MCHESRKASELVLPCIQSLYFVPVLKCLPEERCCCDNRYRKYREPPSRLCAPRVAGEKPDADRHSQTANASEDAPRGSPQHISLDHSPLNLIAEMCIGSVLFESFASRSGG